MDVAADLSSPDPQSGVPSQKVRVLCPYCGRGTLLGSRCEQCKGLLDPLSRQATQNSMGPWFIHDPQNPFRPGCSYDVIRDMVRRGKITAQTVMRGPGTRQYWMIAARTPAVANILGKCHNCQAPVDPSAVSCPQCSADFSPELDRQFLGLGPVHLLPGQAPAEEVARTAAHGHPAKARPHAEPAPAEKVTLARPAPTASETGEYRALLTRLERLDRELGNTRILLGIAAIAVIALAGAVLWFSGVLRPQAKEAGWPTIQGSTPTPASSAPPPPAGQSPEDSPVPATMPPDPDHHPDSGADAAPEPTGGGENPPAQPASNPPKDEPSPAPSERSSSASPPTHAPTPATDAASDAAIVEEWKLLQGIS